MTVNRFLPRGTLRTTTNTHDFVCIHESEKPEDRVRDGDTCTVLEAGKYYVRTGGAWVLDTTFSGGSPIDDAVVNGVVDRAPSQNAVYDAIATALALAFSYTDSAIAGAPHSLSIGGTFEGFNTADTGDAAHPNITGTLTLLTAYVPIAVATNIVVSWLINGSVVATATITAGANSGSSGALSIAQSSSDYNSASMICADGATDVECRADYTL